MSGAAAVAEKGQSAGVGWQQRLREDPVSFCRAVLRVDPWEKQAEILRALVGNQEVAVRSCHGAGKTALAAWAVCWFVTMFPRSRVITTAPTARQVRELLWVEIAKAHRGSSPPMGGRLAMTRLEFARDWFAVGYSTDDADRFQGHHAENILFVFDEASGVPDEIWLGSDGSMTTAGAKRLTIGNPRNLHGRFFDAFKTPGIAKFAISAFDTPNLQAHKTVRPYLVTEKWVNDRRAQWGEDSVEWYYKVLGEFPDVSDDTLIAMRWIDAAQKRMETAERADSAGPCELGVDVARFGSDETVFALRRGRMCFILKTLKGADTMRVAGEVKAALTETGATLARIDSVGVGGGVFDRLLEQGVPVEAFESAGRANDAERYKNKRAEWFWYLREQFRDNVIIMRKDDQAATELSRLKFRYDSAGHIVMESKEDAKRRGVGSPDRADAIMMAFAGGSAPMPWKANVDFF